MERAVVERIFTEHGLGTVDSLVRIETGFTNHVSLVNEAFIFKVCVDTSNEQRFEAEAFLCSLFRDTLPVPRIIVFDRSKTLCEKSFMIYPKIEGETLYSKWHVLSDDQRRSIIKQLCDILRIINQTPYDGFLQRFGTDRHNWHDTILKRIHDPLQVVEKRSILPAQSIKAITTFVNEHHRVLEEEKRALVHSDIHFDNILIHDTAIVGILDLERTEVASIDFVLDVVKRMVSYPKKYMSKASEQFADEEDYARLLDWFEEYYPELFAFENLNVRLALYAIGYDLGTLIDYPNSAEVKQMIADTLRHHHTA